MAVPSTLPDFSISNPFYYDNINHSSIGSFPAMDSFCLDFPPHNLPSSESIWPEPLFENAVLPGEPVIKTAEAMAYAQVHRSFNGVWSSSMLKESAFGSSLFPLANLSIPGF